jgi:4-amino-4-deoxy-L-arabinose transferase-like glycosyltransferase
MNTAATRSPWHTARQRLARLLPAVVLLSLALLARIAGAWWYAHDANPDYGIVVLMARNIARGVDFPVFFYGQPYMGSFEPMLSAVLARLFGDSPFVICLGTALLSFVMVVALAHLARRVAGPWAALAAVALCIVGTPGFFHYNVSPRGGYALALLLTVLLLHAGIFMETRAETAAERRALAWRLAVFGLLGGLGFWNFWLTLPALAAAGLLLLIRLRWRVFHWRVWLPALAGFMLGSLPWWIWNARHDWASLTSTSASSGLRASLAALVKLPLERVPKLIGAVDFLPAGHYGRIVIHLLVLFLAVLPLVVLVLEWRKSEAAPMRRLAAGFLLYAALFTMAYGFSSFGAIPSSRYLLPLVPIYAVWAGCGITRCLVVARSRDAARRSSAMSLAVPGMLALVLLVALSVWTLKAHAARATRQHHWIESAQLLAEHPVAREALFAKFDLFGINWATDEQVCAVSPEIWRYTPYLERLEAARSPGVLENMGASITFWSRPAGRPSTSG